MDDPIGCTGSAGQRLIPFGTLFASSGPRRRGLAAGVSMPAEPILPILPAPDGKAHPVQSTLSESSEAFTYLRRVSFGDADPAGTLFFANISRYCMEAIELWFVDRLGADWLQLSVDRGIGTPFVRVELDFLSPATPGDTLAIVVTVTELGRSSVVFDVKGKIAESKRLCWHGRFKCVFIDAKTARGIPIPEGYRTAMAHGSTRG
jgi:4-hydroxybenzoyl-CoA thioesterase